MTYPPSLLRHHSPLTTRSFSFLILDAHTIPDNISSKDRQEAKIKWPRCGIWHSAVANYPHWLPFHFSTGFTIFSLRGFPVLGAAQIHPGDGYRVLFLSTWPLPKLSLGQVIFRFISFQSKVTYINIRSETSQILPQPQGLFQGFCLQLILTYLFDFPVLSCVHCLPGFTSVTCFRLSSLALLSN